MENLMAALLPSNSKLHTSHFTLSERSERKMIYLCNTFSVSMLPRCEVNQSRGVMVERISAAQAGEMLRREKVVSAFGHAWAAWHLSRYLKVEIPVSRAEIVLKPGDRLIVAAVVNKNRWKSRIEGMPRWVFYEVEVYRE